MESELEASRRECAQMKSAIELTLEMLIPARSTHDDVGGLRNLRMSLSGVATKNFVRREVLEKCVEALAMAKNTVECASVETRGYPFVKGEELPWYKAANKAIEAATAELA